MIFFTRMTKFHMNKNEIVIDLDFREVKLCVLVEKVGNIGAFRPCQANMMECFEGSSGKNWWGNNFTCKEVS